MVAVAIIAVLAAAAIPQYRAFVWRAKRAEAITLLASVNIGQESWYSTNQTYLPDNCNSETCAITGCLYNGSAVKDINNRIGLGYFDNSNGWIFSSQHPSYPFGYRAWARIDGTGYKTYGYMVAITQDIDRNPSDVWYRKDDYWVLKRNVNPACGWGQIPPDGVPYQYVDDILDVQYVL